MALSEREKARLMPDLRPDRPDRRRDPLKVLLLVRWIAALLILSRWLFSFNLGFIKCRNIIGSFYLLSV
jgi:hypothetical protein